MKKIMKKIITVLAFSTLTKTPVYSEAKEVHGTVEVMPGTEMTTLDYELRAPLIDKVNFYLRNRFSSDYGGNINMFQINSLAFNLVDGLDLEAEIDVSSNNPTDPRIGLQYFYGSKLVNAFGLLSTSLNEKDVGILADVEIKPKISENLGVLVGSELVYQHGKQGSKFFSTRNKLGFSFKDYSGGIFGDYTQIRKDINFHNLGLFVKKNF